ncbi:MAG: class I SAM-dependent methyltransferase [Nitrospiraceae bacterium]
MEAGRFVDLPRRIKDADLVLDVGGGIRPLSRANYVLDFLAYDERYAVEPWLTDQWPTPYYSQDTWIQRDFCSHQPWPFHDKQFDFVLCKGTLEDLRDPVWVCQEMMRVGKAGYIETPTRVLESLPGIERSRYCGHSHHHWMVEAVDGGVRFTFKHAQLHAYARFHPTVGPRFWGGGANHNPFEALDIVERVSAVVNRWFRRLNPKYLTLGLYWTDSFVCYEHVLVDKGAVEADFMAFKDYCESLPDLWVSKKS